MTTEIEKTFFDTFGIEPIKECKHFLMGDAYHNNDCDNPNNKCDVCEDLLTIQDRITCPYYERDMEHYPTITDSILLKLICIANEVYIDLEGTDIETMKNSLLENFIFFRRDVYDQVRTLFEEG